LLAAPLFAGSYLGVWGLAGLAMWLLYQPPGAAASGVLLIGAGVYEFTPPKRECRRRCSERVARAPGWAPSALARASG
jgi:predicted metal-binding membrane protein